MSFLGTLKAVNRARNIKTKKIKNSIKLAYFRLGYRDKTKLTPSKYKNICIFMHTQAIGDGIVTSGFIKVLRDNGYNVSVVTQKRAASLFDGIIEVDGVYVTERKTIKKTARLLNETSVDLVIDLSDFDNSSVLREKTLSLINCKHSISFNHPSKTIYDTNIITSQSEHITSRMTHVLSLLGIKDDCKPFLKFKNPMSKEPEDFVNSLGNKLIIFNPFASVESRSFSNEQIDSILGYLNQLNGYTTIVFNIGRGVNISQYDNVTLNPFKELDKSFMLVQYAKFVITVDTAIVHLASALKVKQYCIYNNRKFNNKFENNIVWGPNSELAVQITTNDYVGTELGDDMKNFDVSMLLNKIDSDINAGAFFG
ncbi:glycosyltransferase family 9 protein [Providencia rettgeri]|uniref:glycosyltransferase family 9 protein n=1 Tax=Providencia rettgeri TaxID=587 RepID=UPI0035269179